MCRRLIICLLTASCLLACQSTDQESQKTNYEQPVLPWKLICLGDGITAGVGLAPDEAFPALLQAQLSESGHTVKIVNAGIKGETVSGADQRVEWILQQRLSAILFALGCQDQQSNKDPAAVLSSWESLLRKVRAAYPDIPLFISVPCAESGVFTQNAFYNNLLARFQAEFIPLGIGNSPQEWSTITNCPTVKGQEELARQVLSAIGSILPAK